MKLRVLWVGKTRSPELNRLIEDYSSRISHFLPLDKSEVREPKGEGTKRIEAEGEKLLEAVGRSDRVIALDPNGREWTSEQLADFIRKHMNEDARNLTFVVGGYAGLSGAVRLRADIRWSLSPLTFTHDLTRVILLEQIYRALSIIHNLPYSK